MWKEVRISMLLALFCRTHCLEHVRVFVTVLTHEAKEQDLDIHT